MRWGEERFGMYIWVYSDCLDWQGLAVTWTINQMFGNTTFAFKNVDDALEFEKYLKTLELEDARVRENFTPG